MAKIDKEQVELGKRLQKLLLESYEKALKDGTATAADRAALGRLLRENGWSIDPDDIPQSIRQYLPTSVDPTQFSDDDPDVEVN